MHNQKEEFLGPGSEHIFCISKAINMWWGGRVGTQTWKGMPGLAVMLLHSDSTLRAYLLVRDRNQQHHACVCAWHEMQELIMVESRKGIGYTIANPGDVLQREVKIVLHAKHGQWANQNHHGLALRGAFGHDLHNQCVVAVNQDPLALELIPEIARAMAMVYSSLQLILMSLSWKQASGNLP